MSISHQPNTSAVDAGGLTRFHLTAAAGANLTTVKAIPGQIFFISALSTQAAIRYLKIYDALIGNITLGTTPASDQYPIPGNSGGAGFNINIIAGLQYNNGIVIALTANPALTDSTGIAQYDVILNIGFK